MKSHRILPTALLLCTLAACGQTPTGSAPPAQPAGASFEGGGYTIGSGRNTQEPDSTTTQDTGGFGMGGGSEESTSTTSSPDAERGGYTIGSGG